MLINSFNAVRSRKAIIRGQVDYDGITLFIAEKAEMRVVKARLKTGNSVDNEKR